VRLSKTIKVERGSVGKKIDNHTLINGGVHLENNLIKVEKKLNT
jgi:hypothetical protein